MRSIGKIRQKLAWLLFFGVLGVAWADSVCRCLPRPPLEHKDLAQVVFSGVVTSDKESLSPFSKMVRVEVDTVWKGEVAETVLVSTPIPPASCGLDVRPGKRIVFFSALYQGEGQLHGGYPVSQCEGSKPWSEEYQEELGPPLETILPKNNWIPSTSLSEASEGGGASSLAIPIP